MIRAKRQQRQLVTEQSAPTQQALDNASDAIYWIDEDGQHGYANSAACTLLGYSCDALLSLSLFDYSERITPADWRRIVHQVLAGQASRLETVYRRRDGTAVPVEASLGPLNDNGRSMVCIIAREVDTDFAERKEMERRLRVTQFAVDSAGDAILFTNSKGNILYANQTARQSLGYSEDELLRKTINEITTSGMNAAWGRDCSWKSAVPGQSMTFQSRYRHRDGHVFPVEVKSTIMDFESETFNCKVVRDITDRLRVEEALRYSEERFRIISDTSPVALLISSVSDGTIIYANRQVEALFQADSAEILGSCLFKLFENVEASSDIMDLLKAGQRIHGSEIKLNGETPLWLSLTAKPIFLQGERVICSAFLDVTEAHELSKKLSHHATYDPLTGLVNRREFEDRLQQTVKTAHKTRSQNALCFLDLDQFKVINDSCGHTAGDELLRQLAPVLQGCLREDDLLARLGGDEFAVLIHDCSLHDAERIANAILHAVQQFRFAWQGNTFSLGISIGLVAIGRSETAANLLRRADVACYTAKETGRSRIHVYRPDDEEMARRRGQIQWTDRLNSAMEHNLLKLWAQKITPIDDSADEGEHFEILLRMVDEEGNVIPPAAFLPAAERCNLASRIDRYVVSNTFAWFSERPERLAQLSMCSINLSGQSLGDQDFARQILNCLDSFKVPAEKFCFEITETAAIANLAHATEFLWALKERGCSFALDDFGSGLSSFAYLKNLPIDFLKIDGLFVRDILSDPIDLAMVKSINDIAHLMGKKTIAEYVENEQILEKLRDVGVDYAQGYGIAKPAPLEGQG